MLCSACQRENRPDAQFCLQCGAPLPRICDACGRELPGDAAFCDGCGRALAPARAGASAIRAPESGRDSRAGPIARFYTPPHLADRVLRSRSALEGEHKQVTVLFADVKGSVELATQVDPEEWHATMDRFFLILAEGVHRFEGTINQYTGDGIMALFGAPIAHEDHAQRCCFAALTLKERLRDFARELRRRGLDFGVRMALHSGEVIVGKIGDDLRMDYTAKGQTVSLAARIEQIAEAGRIYVSETTQSRLVGQFLFEDLGEFQLKGIPEPARVFELQGVGPLRSRLEVAGARGFSHFVGRAAEMGALEAALERASAGAGQVIGLVAEAGTGKSRLCFEFSECCREKGVSIFRAQGVSHGAGLPLYPILELLRDVLGVTESDDSQRARQKIAGAMVLLDHELEAALPAVFDFMGVSDGERSNALPEPEERQRQLLEILTRAIIDRAARGPVLICVEDLHWIDTSSEAMLGKLAAAISGARVLLLLNYRPEFRAEWMQSASQIALGPLDGSATHELLVDLLGTDSTVAALPDLIRARTRGNPFFAEEVVWSLAEAGTLTGERGRFRLGDPDLSIDLPDSVQSVLAARIDRQGDDAKALLHTAAVIGMQFSEELIERVSDLSAGERRAALAALVSAGLVFEEALYPRARYAFAHPLMLEVAYRSQLGERRRRIHEATARAIGELDADRLDERAALLAHHWESAQNELEAAHWHARAAELAGFVDATAGLFHWSRVRALADADETADDDWHSLRLSACWRTLEMSGRAEISPADAMVLFEEGRRLAEPRGDVRALVRLHTALAARLGWSGDPDGQRQHLAEATRLAERVVDLEVRLTVLHRRYVAEFTGGDLRAALTLARQGVEQAEAAPEFGAPGRRPYLYWRLLLGVANALALRGELAASAAVLQRGDQLAAAGEASADWERTAHTRLLVRTSLSVYRGDVEAGLREAAAFVALAERSRSSWAAPISRLSLGRAQLLAGRFREARDALEDSLRRARESHLGLESEAAILACLATARTGCGDAERAVATAEEAIAVAVRDAARFWELEAQLAFASARLAASGAAGQAQVGAALERANQLVEETGGAVMRPAVARGRAELNRVLGDDAGCARELREAARLYIEIGAPDHAARLAVI